MATPTKAELWSQISAFIKIIDQGWKYAATNSPNFVGLQDALEQLLEGQHAVQVTQYLQQARAELNSRYLAGASTLRLMLIELAKWGYAVNTVSLTDAQIFEKLAEAMDTAGETIATRAYTFGSISAGGSNVSSATVLRNTKDRFDEPIEVAEVGVQRIEVIQDSSQGAQQGQELVRFFGQGNPRVDRIQLGTSTDKVVQGKLINSSNSLLINGSFDAIETTLTKAEQTGWTLNDISLFSKETTTFFRWKSGDEARLNGTGASLKALSGTTNIWFAQYISREKLRIESGVPYFLVLRVMVDNASTDGTLTLRLGSKTVTLDVSTLSANTWANVIIGTDDKGYFENFKERWVSAANQDLGIRVRVDVASRTVAGAIFFDEIVLVKGVYFNGAYYCPLAGQNTATNTDAQTGDLWTFTDSATNAGRNQYTIAELLGVSLPSDASPTYADA